jgi:hypothetical protein
MTLILSAVTNHCAFHASDRQVSKKERPNSRYRPHDLHSNKTVIVVARDCWLVIGYTGLADLDDKPTDQFIAEAISQRKLGEGSSVHFGDFRDSRLHYMEVRRRIIDDGGISAPRSTVQEYCNHGADRGYPTDEATTPNHPVQVFGSGWLVLAVPGQARPTPAVQRLATDVGPSNS